MILGSLKGRRARVKHSSPAAAAAGTRYLPVMLARAHGASARAARLRRLAAVALSLCACAPLATQRDTSTDSPAARGDAPRALPALELAGYTFHRRQLANGLRGVTVRDDTARVSVFVVVAAGKRQETPRTTGLAHLTEHVMFAGTPTTAAGEHEHRIAALGGTSNAFTRDDYTVFYDHRIPADHLEEVLAMEADRLRNLSFDPDAVYRERARLREEESRTWQPSEQLAELVESRVYRVHSYRAGLIDAEGHTLGSLLGIWDARGFYDRHYHPRRSAVVVAGPVDPERALDAIAAAFGPLPAGPAPEPIPEEPPIREARSERLASALPRDRVEWVYLAPAVGSPDRPALQLLARLLSRRSTRSGAPLFVSTGDRVDKELFRIAVVGPDAQRDLEALVADLLAQGVDPAELEAAKRLELREERNVSLHERPYFSLAVSFGAHEALGHTDALLRYASEVAQLDAAALDRVAHTYLAPDERVTLYLEGTGAASPPLPDDPAALQRAADDAAQAGDLDGAIAAYSKLLSLETSKMTRVIALAERGEVWLQKRDYRAAIADFERALELVDYPALRDRLDEARALEAGDLGGSRRGDPPRERGAPVP